MNKEQMLAIIERMRKNGERSNVLLSATINQKLRAGKMKEVYELLTKDNLLIILRSVVKQHERIDSLENLNMPLFQEIVKSKGLENEMLVQLFEKCIEINEVGIFIHVTNIIN